MYTYFKSREERIVIKYQVLKNVFDSEDRIVVQKVLSVFDTAEKAMDECVKQAISDEDNAEFLAVCVRG